MPDGVVSATEANRHFSRLLKEVENGGTVTITKDGKPVAVLAPVGAVTADRERAVRHMMDLLEKGIPIGYTGPLDRDELHRRR